MNDKVSPEEEPEEIIVKGYDRMLTLLDKDYEVEEELRGEMFLMRKVSKRAI